MARNFAANGQQGQRPGTGNKSRGGFYRGQGKFNAVQGSHINPPISSSVSQVQTQPLAVQSTSGQTSSGRRNALCYNCNGYGHYAWECPSASRTAQRGGRPMRGRWLTRGRRGGRGRGRRGGRSGPQMPTHATLVQSEPAGSMSELQPAQVPPSVPGLQTGQGN